MAGDPADFYLEHDLTHFLDDSGEVFGKVLSKNSASGTCLTPVFTGAEIIGRAVRARRLTRLPALDMSNYRILVSKQNSLPGKKAPILLHG